MNYYINIRNNIIKEYNKLKATKKWKFVIEKEGTKMYKTEIPEVCDFPAYLISTVINKPKDEIIKKLWNISEIEAKKNDPNLIKRIEIETGQNYKILSQYNATTWPITPRHFVFLQMKIDIDDKTYIISRSIEHKNVLREDDSYVRGIIYMSVYEYKYIDCNKTLINQITHIDPKGYLPVWLVDLYSNNFVNMFNLWKK